MITTLGVRQEAMAILGRLTVKNPAYVFPPLRKLLHNFTMGIWASHDAKFEEEGAKLISMCIVNSCDLVKPFVEKLVKVLLPKATDTNAAVASTVITAIGDLATLGGKDMKKHIPVLMPIIIEALQDLSSPAKRDASLKALGQLASNSGYVIKPYVDYPQLLDLLTNIIKTEQQGNLRTETIKLLGILGALDPYKHQQSAENTPDTSDTEPQYTSDVALIMNGMNPSNEEYYPTVVMNVLMHNVLRDNSLSQYHAAVVEAIVNIFRSLGVKCVAFLKHIVPLFITIIRAAPANRLESYFNQLSMLVSIVRDHIRPYVDDLVQVCLDFWDIHPAPQAAGVQITVLSLIEALSKSLQNEFYLSIVKFLPSMMQVFDTDTSPRRQASERVLNTLLIFGSSAEQSMWHILPKLVRVYQNTSNPVALRKQAVETIAKISRQTNIIDYTGLLMHSLPQLLGDHDRVIKQAAYDCICALIFQFGSDFLPYADGIKMNLITYNILSTTFDTLVSRLRNKEPLPQNLSPENIYGGMHDDMVQADAMHRKLPVNQEHLKSSWEASQKSTRDDWTEWMRRFSVQLLNESPSNALRACAPLASVYQPLAKDLFNAAFVSCWTELYDQYQEELVRSLETALASPNIPPEILQILLNLAEFMEHDDKPLPIDIGTLGIYAGRCHAYAKALHYKELEFEEEKTPSVVEALISINNQLQQTDAAVGILRNAQKYRDFELKETWFEKLGRWDEALQAYQSRDNPEDVEAEPEPFEITMGKMRCLHALGEWDLLSKLAQEKWAPAPKEHKRLIAPLAAAASWGLGQWEPMSDYLAVMRHGSPNRSFFEAIFALHWNQFDRAQCHIDTAREGLNTELSALLGESYTRAYGVVVRVQMLAELEEIISYKRADNNLERQATMRETWKTRLEGCEGNVETWQRMLKVRALVLTPAENIEMWIKFANLCRKAGRIGLAEKSLSALQPMGLEPGNDLLTIASGIPEVTYAQLKYAWALGKQETALDGLHEFTINLSSQFSAQSAAHEEATAVPPNPLNIFHDGRATLQAKEAERLAGMRDLLSKCFLKLGQWQTASIDGDWKNDHVHEILASYREATRYNQNGYKAWHAWALANFEVVTSMTSPSQSEARNLHTDTHAENVMDYVVPAVTGFFRSIELSTSKSCLQDTLRLLTLWFAHGGDQDVDRAISEGISGVSMDTWLEVIPQLIARINQPNSRVRYAILKLLCAVGKFHPQALVYPLTVAMKSDIARRSESAKFILNSLSSHSKILVDQAQVISKELIRVAVLWHELWHEGLEEASRL